MDEAYVVVNRHRLAVTRAHSRGLSFGRLPMLRDSSGDFPLLFPTRAAAEAALARTRGGYEVRQVGLVGGEFRCACGRSIVRLTETPLHTLVLSHAKECYSALPCLKVGKVE